MLVPVPMRKLELFVAASDVEATTTALARFGQFQPTNVDDDAWSETSSHWAGLAERYANEQRRAERLLAHFDIEKASLSEPTHLIPEQDLEKLDTELEQAEKEVDAWCQESQRKRSEIEQLKRSISKLELLAPVEFPAERLRAARYLHWVVGTLPQENLEVLQYALLGTSSPRPVGLGRSLRRLDVFVSADDVESATSALLKLPSFTLARAEQRAWNQESPDWQELADQYSQQQQRIEFVLRELELSVPELPYPERYSPSCDAQASASEISAAEAPVKEWRQGRDDARAKVNELKRRIRDLELLLEVDVPLAALRDGRQLAWHLGWMDVEAFEHLEVILGEMPAVVMPLAEQQKRSLIVAATTPSHAEPLLAALQSVFFTPAELPRGEGRPTAVRRELEEQLESAERRLSETEGKQQQLVQRFKDRLWALWQRVHADAQVTSAILNHGRCGDVFLISGTTREADLDEVLAALEQATEGRAEFTPHESATRRDRWREARRRRKLQPPLALSLLRVPMVLIPVPSDGDRALVLAATSRQYAEILDRALRGVFFEPNELPKDLCGLPSERLPELNRRLADARQHMQKLDARRRELARRWRATLLAGWRQSANNGAIASAISSFPQRHGTFLVSGWVPASEADRVMEPVKTATAGRVDVQVVEPRAGGFRQPPTSFRNPRVLRPFQLIVRTFGYPGYHELDPTPLVALFFVVMYGLMFGDIGHGLTLAVVGLVVSRAKSATLHALGWLLVPAGLSAAVFGGLYGSVFGREDVLHARWLVPLRDINELLLASVLGGAVLLSVSYLAYIATAIRTRRWASLLFGHGGLAGAALYFSMIGGGYAAYRGWLTPSALLLALALPAAVLLLHEPLERLVERRRPLIEEQPATYVARSTFELVELVLANVSNTVSFVRLGAFAVAHAGLMTVIFSAAQRADGVLYWVIVVLGTLLVLALDGLVVGIQALRLEYYEFLSRFFEGSGQPFRPLRLLSGHRLQSANTTQQEDR